MRVLFHRLWAFGRLHRFAVFGLCMSLTGWSWWAAQASGYAGLPVNTLGQITGDLILMGLVAPLTRRGQPRDAGEMAAIPSPTGALAGATHRIQLLDVRVCLPQLVAVQPGPSGAAPAERLGGLAQAVRTALGNDACIEILLPDPEAPASREVAQSLGIEPSLYDQSLLCLLDDLAAVSEAAESGRLDLRLYAESVSLSIIRCDERIWTSLHPDGLSAAPGYLALDQGSENARTLQAYFNRLYSAARSPLRTRGDPTRSILDSRTRERSRAGSGCHGQA